MHMLRLAEVPSYFRGCPSVIGSAMVGGSGPGQRAPAPVGLWDVGAVVELVLAVPVHWHRRPGRSVGGG